LQLLRLVGTHASTVVGEVRQMKLRLVRAQHCFVTRRCNQFLASFLEKRRANYTQLSPVSQLKNTLFQYPNVTCYVHGEISRTWSQVGERIKRFAGALESSGIGKDDVVSIIAPNSPSIFEAHFAVPSTGAVLHSINTRSDPTTIAFQLRHAQSKVLIVDSEHTDVIKSALDILASEDKPLSSKMTIIQVFDDPEFPQHSQVAGKFFS
jgi:fatty-acyl-CoA synthase